MLEYYIFGIIITWLFTRKKLYCTAIAWFMVIGSVSQPEAPGLYGFIMILIGIYFTIVNHIK